MSARNPKLLGVSLAFVILVFCPSLTFSQLIPQTYDELKAAEWQQRVAQISLTDTAGMTREGYILYSRLNGFVWHEGYSVYQPGDTFSWIPTAAWVQLEANRRGFWGKRILRTSLITMQVIGSSFLIGNMGQRIDWRRGTINGTAATLTLGALAGLSIGGGTGLFMYRGKRKYQNWSSDQRQLAMLAAYPGQFRADTVNGLLVPREGALGFLSSPRPQPAIGIEGMRGGFLPWSESGLGNTSFELSRETQLEPLYQIPAGLGEWSIFWRFRSGTHVGIRTAQPTVEVSRTIVESNAGVATNFSYAGNYTLFRARAWGLFAEQQLWPRKHHALSRWRLSGGGGLFLQPISTETTLLVPRPPFALMQRDSSTLFGGHLDLRLSHYLSRHFRIYTLFRGQWTLPWTPNPLTVVPAPANFRIRHEAVNQSGFTLGLGATAFIH